MQAANKMSEAASTAPADLADPFKNGSKVGQRLSFLLVAFLSLLVCREGTGQGILWGSSIVGEGITFFFFFFPHWMLSSQGSV